MFLVEIGHRIKFTLLIIKKNLHGFISGHCLFGCGNVMCKPHKSNRLNKLLVNSSSNNCWVASPRAFNRMNGSKKLNYQFSFKFFYSIKPSHSANPHNAIKDSGRIMVSDSQILKICFTS